MKRVWALYRVSDKTQVSNLGGENGGDIPMQEKSCRDFIRKQDGWELTNEVKELGVSGWKNSTENRDALVKIKEAAINNEFDILLVFLFDRIGRRESESPLVVQFLVEHDIEVWSVKEGQAKIEQHSDLLMNYIRFWQSSGESKKISIRVTEAMEQMNEKGDFTGGTIPYGFSLIETNIPHAKKDRNLNKLGINKEESEVVKLIFDLTLTKGFGATRITKYLNDNGYDNRGKIWRHNTISRILRNPVYMGRKRYNLTNDDRKLNSIDEWKLQPLNDDIVIIPEGEFLKAQEAIENRKPKKGRSIDAPTSSKLLLSGVAVCGYCGHKLKADYSIKKYKRKTDGVVTETFQPRYRCHHASNTSNHPKSTYGAKMYEEEVEKVVIDILSRLNLESFTEEANKYKNENISQKVSQLNKLKDQLQSKLRQLDKLNDEVANSLLGESQFKPEQLSKAIDKVENDIDVINKQITVMEVEINSSKVEMSDIEQLKTEFKDWTSKYENADINSKKMMLSRILKEVKFKEKEINVSLKLTIENTLMNNDENGAHKHLESNSVRGANTLQDLLRKHLDTQGLRNIEFAIESKVD